MIIPSASPLLLPNTVMTRIQALCMHFLLGLGVANAFRLAHSRGGLSSRPSVGGPLSFRLQSSVAPLNEPDDDIKTTFRSQAVQRLNNLSLPVQCLITAVAYALHVSVLSQHQVLFPVELLRNPHGHFASIGWDSLVGVGLLAGYLRWRAPRARPWKLPISSPRHRLTSVWTIFLLVQAYFQTGRWSLFWEDLLYDMSAMGWPMTPALHRSLCVLLGHMTWMLAGTLLLRWIPRPPRFFGPRPSMDDPTAESEKEKSSADQYRWFHSSNHENWVWWVIGGFCVSSFAFNMADGINHYIIPASIIEAQPESVISTLVNPQRNEFLASAVGFIAPCLTAPWWEEVLYRGFLLPVLTALLGFPWAVLVQGIVFSAHHMSVTTALPLAVLGWTWALVYKESGNLFNVILIHMLWNSRVFLDSWLGM